MKVPEYITIAIRQVHATSLILFLLSASQHRYTSNNGLDGLDTTRSQLSIRQGLAKERDKLEYGPGYARDQRAVGATPQIQSPDRTVGATSQIKSPLHSQDVGPSPVSEETFTKVSYGPAKNEVPLNQPRQEESRLLEHLLTNYDKRVRPVLDAKKNITIEVGITLTQIFDMVST